MKNVVIGVVALSLLGFTGTAVWLLTRSDEPGISGPRYSRPLPAKRQEAARRPASLRVENVALGKSRVRVSEAIAALRQVGLWARLTRHLYVVRIGSRPGVTDVPDDRHLADVYLRGQIDDGGAGGVCDVMFYPRAIKDDLDRAAAYHSQGLGEAPPSLEDFWASVLAHELAHCLPHRNEKGFPRLAPEAEAEEWEERAIARLQA